jgi:hypothetical protein
MTDTILTSLDVSKRPRTADEAAVWYAAALGWPVTPGIGLDSDATHSRTPSEGLDCSGAWLAPGPWQWAASAVPDLVRTVWRLSPGSPVLAVLGRPVPGARRLGIVDVPSLVGVAALERLGKNPAAVGPITDGQGRIRFLVDLGADGEPEYGLSKWREVGVDLRIWGRGRCCPLPTPGAVGPSWVVWAVPPDPQRRTLPHARQVTAVLDRAVRDAYPSLWDAAVHQEQALS